VTKSAFFSRLPRLRLKCLVHSSFDPPVSFLVALTPKLKRPALASEPTLSRQVSNEAKPLF